MTRTISAVIGVALACTLQTSPVMSQTQPAGDPPAKQDHAAATAALDAALPKLDAVCYGRVYDAAHLKQRPKQAVTSVRLIRDFNAIRLERGMEAGREAKEGRKAYASLVVTYRDRPGKRFAGGATCYVEAGGTIRCSSDSCDGGGFRLRVENPDTILIGDREPGARFSVSGGCAGGENRNLNAGEDDTVFRLSRMPLSQCR